MPGRRVAERIALGLTLLGGGMLLAACESESPPTPVACLDGPQPFLAALDRSEDPVQLGDGTRISDCLPDNQPAGQQAEVGEALVSVATFLNGRARNDPGGEANIALGYLLGAVENGASGSGGIHEELLRRVEMSARFFPGKAEPPAAFERALERGAEAGRDHG